MIILQQLKLRSSQNICRNLMNTYHHYRLQKFIGYSIQLHISNLWYHFHLRPRILALCMHSQLRNHKETQILMDQYWFLVSTRNDNKQPIYLLIEWSKGQPVDDSWEHFSIIPLSTLWIHEYYLWSYKRIASLLLEARKGQD